ncbi:hypothetical protein BDC45DRAFT_535877 [Circinella umbellata]|nr:hypothetical protein BDC45DRAFT_535877 [Circinella umbellata]
MTVFGVARFGSSLSLSTTQIYKTTCVSDLLENVKSNTSTHDRVFPLAIVPGVHDFTSRVIYVELSCLDLQNLKLLVVYTLYFSFINLYFPQQREKAIYEHRLEGEVYQDKECQINSLTRLEKSIVLSIGSQDGLEGMASSTRYYNNYYNNCYKDYIKTPEITRCPLKVVIKKKEREMLLSISKADSTNDIEVITKGLEGCSPTSRQTAASEGLTPRSEAEGLNPQRSSKVFVPGTFHSKFKLKERNAMQMLSST